MKKIDNRKQSNRGKKVKINKKEFEMLIKQLATQEDIANNFGCSRDTVQKFCQENYNGSFSTVYKRLTSESFRSIRRVLYEKAIGGDINAIKLLGTKNLELGEYNQEFQDEKLKEQKLKNKKIENENKILEKQLSGEMQMTPLHTLLVEVKENVKHIDKADDSDK